MFNIRERNLKPPVARNIVKEEREISRAERKSEPVDDSREISSFFEEGEDTEEQGSNLEKFMEEIEVTTSRSTSTEVINSLSSEKLTELLESGYNSEGMLLKPLDRILMAQLLYSRQNQIEEGKHLLVLPPMAVRTPEVGIYRQSRDHVGLVSLKEVTESKVKEANLISLEVLKAIPQMRYMRYKDFTKVELILGGIKYYDLGPWKVSVRQAKLEMFYNLLWYLYRLSEQGFEDESARVEREIERSRVFLQEMFEEPDSKISVVLDGDYEYGAARSKLMGYLRKMQIHEPHFKAIEGNRDPRTGRMTFSVSAELEGVEYYSTKRFARKRDAIDHLSAGIIFHRKLDVNPEYYQRARRRAVVLGKTFSLEYEKEGLYWRASLLQEGEEKLTSSVVATKRESAAEVCSQWLKKYEGLEVSPDLSSLVESSWVHDVKSLAREVEERKESWNQDAKNMVSLDRQIMLQNKASVGSEGDRMRAFLATLKGEEYTEMKKYMTKDCQSSFFAYLVSIGAPEVSLERYVATLRDRDRWRLYKEYAVWYVGVRLLIDVDTPLVKGSGIAFFEDLVEHDSLYLEKKYGVDSLVISGTERGVCIYYSLALALWLKERKMLRLCEKCSRVALVCLMDPSVDHGWGVCLPFLMEEVML